jgi:acetyltransferase-like isoleucine patch superfamily enzyme
MVKINERFYNFINACEVALYTALMKGRFGSWGKGSYIEPSAKLVCPQLINVGEGVRICDHAWLNAKQNENCFATLSIGSGTYVGRSVQINAFRDVYIGKNVLIADRVFISDADHNYENIDIAISLQGDRFKGRVLIMDGSWLGIGVVILPGVVVGKNAVVAANAVVTKDVPDYAVVAGVPAKVIKYLNIK